MSKTSLRGCISTSTLLQKIAIYKIIQLCPNAVSGYVIGKNNFSSRRCLGVAYNKTKRGFILKDGDGINKTIQTNQKTKQIKKTKPTETNEK